MFRRLLLRPHALRLGGQRRSFSSALLAYHDDDAWCPGWMDVLSSPNTRDRTAILDADGQRVPYSDLLTRATAVASQLRRINHGEALDEQRVPILCPPSADFVASLLGTWIAGGLPCRSTRRRP